MPLLGRFKSYGAYLERKVRTRPPVGEEGEEVECADGVVVVKVPRALSGGGGSGLWPVLRAVSRVVSGPGDPVQRCCLARWDVTSGRSIRDYRVHHRRTG